MSFFFSIVFGPPGGMLNSYSSINPEGLCTDGLCTNALCAKEWCIKMHLLEKVQTLFGWIYFKCLAELLDFLIYNLAR